MADERPLFEHISSTANETVKLLRSLERKRERVETGLFLADTGAFNAGRISSLVPSVQFYSTNPRNSAINIRGIGSPFGLTNDGIEQGVGLYVDGVYYARPAADTALAQLCDAAGRSRWRHLVGSRRQGGLPRDHALCGCAVGR